MNEFLYNLRRKLKTKTKETAAPKETSVGRKLFRDSCDIPLSLNKYTDILKKNSNKPVTIAIEEICTH